MNEIKLPEQLEELRDRKIWVCHPMIYNAKKHNGFGGYDKPPINPYTLRNGYTDRAESLATFDETAAQIGKTATLNVKGYDEPIDTPVVGVGIALGATGICGLDLDSVLRRHVVNEDERELYDRAELIHSRGMGYWMTNEAKEIIYSLKTYTEVSPSGDGLHALFLGSLPKDIAKKVVKPKPDIAGTDKAEYQLMDDGYMTITGNRIGGALKDCTELVAQIYEQYFREVEPIRKLSTTKPALSPSVVSCGGGFTRERWLEDVKRLSDYDLMQRIYASGSTGARVKSLYESGELSEHNNNHSEADLALCAYLYGFTGDRERTERLFRSSALYRATGKSRSYIEHTLTRAEQRSVPLIGHIELTAAEKKAYAKKKEAEESAAFERRFGSFLREKAKRGK